MTKPKSPRQWGTSLPLRSKPIPRGGRPKPKRRTPAQAERIYGPPAFRTWLHAQSCAVCGWRGHSWQMQQAHAKTGGTSRKDDWTRTLPLCGPHVEWAEPMPRFMDGCHAESGNGVKSFEQRHGVTLLALAAKTQRQWQAVCAGWSGGGGTPE